MNWDKYQLPESDADRSIAISELDRTYERLCATVKSNVKPGKVAANHLGKIYSSIQLLKRKVG